MCRIEGKPERPYEKTRLLVQEDLTVRKLGKTYSVVSQL